MKKDLLITKEYLLIPVKMGKILQTVTIRQGDEKIYEYEVAIGAAGEPYCWDYQAAFPVRSWMNEVLTIEGDMPEGFMDAVVLEDEIPAGKGKRPAVHFTPATGWMNDPNGLVYHNGIYHLYFQHNPVNIEWENMTWGHAVSRDLLHWEQLEEAMFPDADGTMYSGSATLNERGMLGLPKDAELYIYTSAGGKSKWSAGKNYVQKVAWSTDNGKTLHKLDECIVDFMVDGNRDPSAYWHEGKGLYYMVMYLEKDEYAILNSPDLKNWEVTQKVRLPQAWECPDLREVPVEGGGTKWVFWTADGYYFVGDFDGSHYTSDEIRKEAYHSMLPYAAQTYSGTERVIIVPWLRTNNLGKNYRGSMGMPRQLTLVEKDGELILRQKLIDEFEQAKECVLSVRLGEGGSDAANVYDGAGVQDAESVCDGTGVQDGANVCSEMSGLNTVTYMQEQDAAVELVLTPENGAGFTADIYGTKITLANGALTISGIAPRSDGVLDAVKLGEKENVVGEDRSGRVVALKGCPEKISLLSDGDILEITIDDGLMGDAFETCVDEKTGLIRVEADGEVGLEINTIK